MDFDEARDGGVAVASTVHHKCIIENIYRNICISVV